MPPDEAQAASAAGIAAVASIAVVADPDRSDDPQAIADSAVAGYARAAAAAAASMAAATDEQITAALTTMAERVTADRTVIDEANGQDLQAAQDAGMSAALRDRLRIDHDRLDEVAAQLRLLAAVPPPTRDTDLGALPNGLRLLERRRPIGVIGVNYEARPLVTIDVASQLLKSRNAGVLRTGSAALASARALHEHVVTPALQTCGIDPRAIELVREPGHEFATALVRQPQQIRLVILRGSGETTASLGAEAARHGVRTLAHAAGGGVLFVDAAADVEVALRLLNEGTDRLGVCNRVNLVLIAASRYDEISRLATAALDEKGIGVSAPPHQHPLDHEWALDTGNEATVTLAPVTDLREAARVANEQTSGLAATIVTEDPAAASEFLGLYAGTGAFHNATTRLLDGVKLLGVPETGINIDNVPGPRGPVTFADLYLRQFVVVPA